MEKLGKDRLTVSDRGLRHGLLAERFDSPTERDLVDGRPAKSDHLRNSIQNKPRTRRTMKAIPNAKRKPTRVAAPDAPISVFSDQQVAKILKLLKGSSSMELKVVVPFPRTGRPSRASGSTRWRRSRGRPISSIPPSLT